jgi:hypothetical protein
VHQCCGSATPAPGGATQGYKEYPCKSQFKVINNLQFGENIKMKLHIFLWMIIGLVFALPPNHQPGLMIDKRSAGTRTFVQHYKRGGKGKSKDSDLTAAAKGDAKGAGGGDFLSGDVNLLGVTIPSILVIGGAGFVIWKYVLKK